MSICFKMNNVRYDCDDWCDYEAYSTCTDHRLHLTSCDGDSLTLGLVATDYNQAVNLPFRVTMADCTYKPLTRDPNSLQVKHLGESCMLERIQCLCKSSSTGKYCYCIWNEPHLGTVYTDIPGTVCYCSRVQFGHVCCCNSTYSWNNCCCHLDAFSSVCLNCLVYKWTYCGNTSVSGMYATDEDHAGYCATTWANVTFIPDDSSYGTQCLLGLMSVGQYNCNIVDCMAWEIACHRDACYTKTHPFTFTNICYTV